MKGNSTMSVTSSQDGSNSVMRKDADWFDKKRKEIEKNSVIKDIIQGILKKRKREKERLEVLKLDKDKKLKI